LHVAIGKRQLAVQHLDDVIADAAVAGIVNFAWPPVVTADISR